jgi:hypothetical protein
MSKFASLIGFHKVETTIFYGPYFYVFKNQSGDRLLNSACAFIMFDSEDWFVCHGI